ncbi:MAG: hypothetical protein GC204_01085 [Chloroflexi bacterium]|nr:hypothetical protein [Chloroflexota bacterium]
MTDQPSESPLSRLFVSNRSPVDEQALADTIASFAVISEQEGAPPRIFLTEEGENLTVREKILIVLLCRKAILLYKKEAIDKEGLSPKEIEDATNIGGGTIRPALKKLSDEHLIEQDKEGAYFVPNRTFRQVTSILRKKEQ